MEPLLHGVETDEKRRFGAVRHVVTPGTPGGDECRRRSEGLPQRVVEIDVHLGTRENHPVCLEYLHDEAVTTRTVRRRLIRVAACTRESSIDAAMIAASAGGTPS